MSIILEKYASPDTGSKIAIEVKVSATLQVSPVQARRLVNRYFMEYVGNALHGATPENLVVDSDQIYWQVPIFLSKGPEGVIGPVGAVRVHIESGELSVTENLIEEIKRNAKRSVADTTPHPIV